jgi:hypothetical protein
MGTDLFQSIFHAIDVEYVDIFVGYHFIDLIGIVNINVKKKFMKIWYKKNKVTLQNISSSKCQGKKVAHEEELVGKLIILPMDTSNDESKSKPEEEYIKSPKGEP